MTSTNTAATVAPATLPSLINGRYRVFTVEHLPYGALPAYPEGPAQVTIEPWCVSTSSLSPLSSPSVLAADDGMTTLSVHKMTGGCEHHAVHGTKHATKDDADRTAYEAGVTGYMIYERDRERLGIAFRVTQHRDADGHFCRVSGCDVVPPEQRATNPNRCPIGCPDSGIEVYIKDDLDA
jgi:hypothetical protein